MVYVESELIDPRSNKYAVPVLFMTIRLTKVQTLDVKLAQKKNTFIYLFYLFIYFFIYLFFHLYFSCMQR